MSKRKYEMTVDETLSELNRIYQELVVGHEYNEDELKHEVLDDYVYARDNIAYKWICHNYTLSEIVYVLQGLVSDDVTIDTLNLFESMEYEILASLFIKNNIKKEIE